jgi:ATP-dependent DNA helicase RecG
MKRVVGQLHRAVGALMARALIEFTIPEKPGSRLQKYRLTAKGRAERSTPL